MKAIYKRELKSYFNSMIGYILLLFLWHLWVFTLWPIICIMVIRTFHINTRSSVP